MGPVDNTNSARHYTSLVAVSSSGKGGEVTAGVAGALNQKALAVSAAVMHILLEMLPFQQQRNPLQRRMCDGQTRNFDGLVMCTAESAVKKAAPRSARMTSFVGGGGLRAFQGAAVQRRL